MTPLSSPNHISMVEMMMVEIMNVLFRILGQICFPLHFFNGNSYLYIGALNEIYDKDINHDDVVNDDDDGEEGEKCE